MKKKSYLTNKTIRFIHELLYNDQHNGVAYKAYMAAAPGTSKMSAKSTSSMLMAQDEVKEYYLAEKQKKQDQVDAELKEKVRETFNLLLNTTVADLYDKDGKPIPLKKLGPKAQLIDQVKVRYDPQGEKIVEYILMPREKILDMLLKRFGMYEPEEAKVEINMPVVEVVAKIDNIETWNQNANE